ncbi:nuclear 5'-3' exoribonuclease-interacting protein, Rai1p [Rhizoctonia solani]|uniref:Decapping nuclease n=1 Tax=Rhizoctonia solani TaxID=456999 RepID=A0A8H8NTW3_9AGAM|nr:nuclear 5'-3' exoribonuclease-interacting protein, Rai1p [Rhizoctonia solani]QRW18248.1 nuclear 5'-3' exoribonuclease-interacting protein, Rai1p [Rhizoctonia solani]
MSNHKRKIQDTDDATLLPPLKQSKVEDKENNKTRVTQYTLSLETSPAEPSPAIGQPQQLTCFSYTPNRELRFDSSALKYYVPAPINADLGYRYEHWTKRPEERGRIDSLLRAIGQDHIVGERKKGAFICWRGVMTNCIYAEEHTTDTALAEKENMAPRQRRMTYYGYSFESFSTWEEPLQRKEQHLERDRTRCWSGDVDTNVQFCSVVKTKIGAERMILGGEVDCCKDRYTGQPNTYVELKTSMVIRNAQDEERFERKLLKFWAQSFLLGVPEIVVGFRSHQGRITTLQTFETLALPRMVRGKPALGIPNRASYLLKNKDATDISSSPTSARRPEEVENMDVWRLEIRPGTRMVTLYKLEPTEVEEVVNDEDRVGFLPTWFWNAVTDKV